MDCDVLRDDQWGRIRCFVPAGQKASVVRTPTTAIFWMLFIGWRVLVVAGATCPNGLAFTSR